MTLIRSTDINSVLLAESAALMETDRVMILSEDATLTTAVAERVQVVEVYHDSVSVLDRYQTLLHSRPQTNIHLHRSPFPVPGAEYDLALLSVPKGRDYARVLLWSAYQALRPGGKLYVGGANDSGIKAILSDAELLFGRNVTLATKSRHRVGVSFRPEATAPYPSAWGADPTQVQIRAFDTPLGSFPMATMPGIFSWEHLDDGTRLLLTAVQQRGEIAEGASVLDIGCGNGIIGVSVAHQAGRVMMTDDSLMAVRCAEESARLNGLTNAEVRASDIYTKITQRFDVILANPPFHRHLEVTTGVAQEMIRGARAHLTPGGRLIIVANSFLGYDRLMTQLNFRLVQELARTTRYVVLQGQVA